MIIISVLAAVCCVYVMYKAYMAIVMSKRRHLNHVDLLIIMSACLYVFMVLLGVSHVQGQ